MRNRGRADDGGRLHEQGYDGGARQSAASGAYALVDDFLDFGDGEGFAGEDVEQADVLQILHETLVDGDARRHVVGGDGADGCPHAAQSEGDQDEGRNRKQRHLPGDPQ